MIAFVGISALVIVTPGPDTAITIRNTLLGGRPGGAATALGVSVGQAIWALATSAGIAALLVASEPVFLAVKYAGAAYLVWLGVQSLRAVFRPAAGDRTACTAKGHGLAPRTAFGQGLLSDLGNPKMAAFFTSLLPQFTPADDFAGLAALGLAFSLMTLIWLAGYTLVVARLGDVLHRPCVRRTIEGITGATLMGLGLKLASEQRG